MSTNQQQQHSSRRDNRARKPHLDPHTKGLAVRDYRDRGRPVGDVAQSFETSTRSVYRWTEKTKAGRSLVRAETDGRCEGGFTTEHVDWIDDFLGQYPLSYLHEAATAFHKKWGQTIDDATIWRILQDHGLRRKVIERRSMHIKINEIWRFSGEMNRLCWLPTKLVFLDELAIDSRGIWRTHSWAPIGQPLVVSGESTRMPRVSLLAFIGVRGLLDLYFVDGTFTRARFAAALDQFLNSDSVFVYPGPNSIWVLDGARIHCSASMMLNLREVGIWPEFLAPYTPFMNPIELFFKVVKDAITKQYREGCTSYSQFVELVIETFLSFKDYDMLPLYEKCGYMCDGSFDPFRNMPPVVKSTMLAGDCEDGDENEDEDE